MNFDKRAVALLEKLEACGHEAYLVGGCVRDALRGELPHDYDATTSALPEAIKAAFPESPVIETGIRHGTVTVLFEDLPIEVTTYRVDGTYADGRHPDGVVFTRSLREDLARRDFTVNAMAWNPATGVVDPFDGRGDLSRGVLRCVGDPERRFSEDALRILRALRFSSVLGFLLDYETEKQAVLLRENLRFVSAERIREELVKLLCGKDVCRVLCGFSSVICAIIPQLAPAVGFDQKNRHHVYDVYEHLAHTVANTPAVPHLRIAALLHDVAKPSLFSLDEKGEGHFYSHAARSAQIADEILGNLRFDNDTRAKVNLLIRHHDGPLEASESFLRRKLNRLGEDLFFDLVALVRADNLALAPQYRDRQRLYDQVESLARTLLQENACFSLSSLALKGDDLLALGYRGPAVGAGLKALLDAVLDGTCPNERESLISLLLSLPIPRKE